MSHNGPTIKFKYLNHKGATSMRTVNVIGVDYISSPGFGYQAGWFLTGWCHDKQATRSFALSHINVSPNGIHPAKHFRLLEL